jgi:hypothetical protein
MPQINMTRRQIEIVTQLDLGELQDAIDRCFDCLSASPLVGQNLDELGNYVVQLLHDFRQDLVAVSKAKSAKKTDEMCAAARESGATLRYAVRSLIDMAHKQLANDASFKVDDYTIRPLTYTTTLSTTVRYSWRDESSETWRHGSIEFSTTSAPTSPATPVPSRATKADIKRYEQAQLARYWEHFRQAALQAVKEFFEKGGNGAAIPRRQVLRATDHNPVISTDSWTLTRNDQPSGSAALP